MLRVWNSAFVVVLAVFFMTAAPAHAGTIHVTVANDENVANGSCSLREAMQAHFNGAAYNGCTGATAGGPNTIVFDQNGTITVTSPLPDVATGKGDLTIDGSGRTVSVACTNSKIFIQQSSTTFNLSNLSIGPCTASGGGIAITSTSATSLSLTNVTVANVHSNDGGDGGAINLSGGGLSIANSSFTSNGTNGTGSGGALALSNIQLPNAASIVTSNFTSNSAGKNGGAIYLSNATPNATAVQLTTVTFTLNTAAGNQTQDGGGAIWAATGPGATNIFLITAGLFTGNQATNGAGGAILLTLDSRLAYASATLPSLGGIYATHFQSNTAGGPAGIDGAGGAIFSRGNLTVVQSSFLSNTSTNSSGGAIATNTGNSYSTTLANVTFNGNTAAQNGGALAKYQGDNWTLINDTIAGNTANAGGSTVGGSLWNNGSASSVAARNSIFSSPSGTGGNCQGTITTSGNNVQNPGTGCAGTITVGDPLLGSATIFAGPNILVFTMEPAATSPALNSGDNATCDAGPILKFDGTGRIAVRPAGSPNCDIGAYESTNPLPVELQKFTIQ